VTVNPSPVAFTVTGGGAYCAGGTGVHIFLSGSATGVNYQLYLGGLPVGTPVAGTGLSLDFGLVTTAGTYTVVGTNTVTTCSGNMTGSVTVSINPLPPLCTVTGGGSICAGSSGLHIGLTCSSIGINYQLTPTGITLPGTGSALDFGLQTTAGTYTVLATNAATGCSRTMSGSATLTVNPLPAAIGGPTALCPGTTITVSDPTTGGTWSSATPSVATVGGTTGIITGLTPGTTIITYTLPTSCAISTIVTVSPAPGPILGPATICVAVPVTLSDIVSGGTWSSSAPGTASIGSLSGVITGVSPGPVTITYSLGGSSCTVTRTMTVNPGPSPVTGPGSVCVGSTIALGDLTPGGTWTSSTPAAGTVSTTGVVTGIAAGTTTISYAVGAGCPSIQTVTVNPLPAAIGGPSVVCSGSTITETDASPGGTWSAAPAVTASIGSLTGVLTGGSSGVATVFYTLGTGCQTSRPVTVNALPGAITGSAAVCVGQTTALADATPGGTWSISGSTVATISSTGVVSGLIPGTDTVTYTIPTGCSISRIITVNALPGAISGTGSICVGSSLTLTDGVGGGTWISASPAIATVGAGTGIVTGVSAGTAIISYASGGCAATVAVTVIAAPVAITGPTHVCVGLTITESDATPGGTWSSGAPLLASVSSSGVVTGIASGTVIISYALGTGCASIVPVVVSPVSAIEGVALICEGQTTILYDTTIGGSWSSSNPAVATITPSGVVTGVSSGIATITYTLPSGCTATRDVTVSPVPSPIGGPSTVCAGSTILLTDPSAGGTWSSASPGIADVSSGGTVTGYTGGTAVISYTYGTGCAATHTVTVHALPPAITGPGTVCVGGSMLLTDAAPGGLWSSSTPAAATIGSSSGLVNGLAPGTTTITYLLPTGCATTTLITVAPALPAITGTPEVCVGGVMLLSDALGGGTWSTSNASVADVDVAGNVFGIGAGAATITYSIGAGCTATLPVTVHALPAAISGPATLCEGATAVLTDVPSSGIWTSSTPSIASIGSATGLISGIATGTATITYTLGTGCYITRTELVIASPAAITGLPQVCVGLTTSLSDATPGGTWSSSSPATGTVDATGTVTGLSAGVTTISYTAAFGCSATVQVTVNNVPTAIAGSPTVCEGFATTYTNGTPLGTWTSSDVFTATAGASTGIITGISTGIATITYTVGAGCIATRAITVNATPAPISGPATVCATQTMTLSDATPGGTWSSASPAIATVGSSSGIVTGTAAGSTTITYSNSAGCYVTYAITVNPMPTAITGNTNVCLGSSNVLYNTVSGGTWMSLNTAVATIGLTSGVVSGLTLGTATIFYTLPAGCSVSTLVHVYPLPLIFTVSGGGSYCAGGTGVHILLSGSTVGVNYMLYRGVTATGSFAGTGGPLDFGLQTVGGTYTVVATTTATGCSQLMSGSAVIGIIPTVTPSVTINTAPGDTVCAGTSVTFSPLPVNGGTSPTYLWRVNGVNVSTGGTYTFLPAPGDVVTAVMTSNALCPSPATATASKTPEVQPWANPSVSISADPGDTVCQGRVVTFNSTQSYGGHGPLYTWMKNGVIAATGASFAYAPVNNDQVYVILNSNYPCRLKNTDSSALIVMTIDTQQTPVVTISANPGTSISQGQSLTLTASVTNGGLSPSYQWLINGIPVAGATNASYTSSSFGYPAEDSVTCMVTSSGQCPATAFKWVFIRVSPVGVREVSTTGGITVWPNPNQGAFTVKGSVGTTQDAIVTLELTDVLGQVVYRDQVTAPGGHLNTEIRPGHQLANGMYLLTLHTDEGTTVFHVVVEQ
jgi:uncharacterized protein YjdB